MQTKKLLCQSKFELLLPRLCRLDFLKESQAADLVPSKKLRQLSLEPFPLFYA